MAPLADQLVAPDTAGTYTFAMRLSEHQRNVIRRTTAEVAGPTARALLFGSRTRPDLRGGDIDLLIELPQPSPDRWAIGIRLGARIERQLGLRKIDILVADPATPDSPVLAAARHDGIPV
jgi:predicted nucleotidyltransferase